MTAPQLHASMAIDRLRQLQAALVARGFDILADGEFGPMTLAAVINFQAATKGLVPDGIVGPNTKTKLGLPLTAAEQAFVG